ncbi:galactosylceramide sulfotransferase-like isoform X2 [Watersipora subatra]|uniref:galactosylceramide sulfotransferase-like isoform X2 n=1 Tax=Watersipora subatra TaxID=2589382 RepID=UPI00355B9A71
MRLSSGWTQLLLCLGVILVVFLLTQTRKPMLFYRRPTGLEDTQKTDFTEQLEKSALMSGDKNTNMSDQGLVNSEKTTSTKQFVMTKVEKTGSSTLFAIMVRFIRFHKLNVLTQCHGHHIPWNPSKFAIGPENVSQADTLVNHAIYNITMISKYIKPGYKHVGLAREPVSWFKSAVNFFANSRNMGLPKQYSPEDVIFNDDILYQTRPTGQGVPRSWLHLNQLQWYGFNYADRYNLTAIENFIASLIPRMDVMLLSDQFDASLLILRKRFNWSYLDIFYTSNRVATGKPSELSNKAITKLLSKEVNLGDKLLYDAMNRTWWQQHELAEASFWEEVSHFRQLNKKVTEYCQTKINQQLQSLTVPASQWHEEFSVTHENCPNFDFSPSGSKSRALIIKYNTNCL